MARRLGFHEKDPYWALIHILDELREGKTVEVVGAEDCYVHRAGAQGETEFIARMRPRFILRAWEALQRVAHRYILLPLKTQIQPTSRRPP